MSETRQQIRERATRRRVLIERARTQGCSVRRIGRLLGISHVAVLKHLRKLAPAGASAGEKSRQQSPYPRSQITASPNPLAGATLVVILWLASAGYGQSLGTWSYALTNPTPVQVSDLTFRALPGGGILLRNVTNALYDSITIDRCDGPGIRAENCENVTFVGCRIATRRDGRVVANSGVGIAFAGGSNLRVIGSTFLYCESSITFGSVTGLTVSGVQSYQPLGPYPRGQHVQMATCASGAVEFCRMEFDPQDMTYPASPVDCVSLFRTSDVTVRRNDIIGGKGKTSGGITMGDDGGDRNAAVSNRLWLAAGGCGIAGGINNRIEANQIYDCHGDGSGLGVCILKPGPGVASSNHVVVGNVVSCWNGTTWRDYWFEPSVSFATNGNLWGAAARPLLSPVPPFMIHCPPTILAITNYVPAWTNIVVTADCPPTRPLPVYLPRDFDAISGLSLSDGSNVWKWGRERQVWQ